MTREEIAEQYEQFFMKKCEENEAISDYEIEKGFIALMYTSPIAKDVLVEGMLSIENYNYLDDDEGHRELYKTYLEEMVDNRR
ncbi:MAG: hypothetical protein RBT33_00740 [Candidatus Dojkabacteria bacterium]|nr:hypothetical protein [Candidatus Dojkabacteria bacterium]